MGGGSYAMPHDEDAGDKIIQDVDTSKLQVSDEVIAKMLARVAAGYVTASGVSSPESAAEKAKAVVASLLQFRGAE